MWEMKKYYLVKERRNILHEIRKRKANWIGHILRRNCLLQQVTEGKIQEVIGRQGRRRRKLLDDLKERRGYSHLKEEALDRTMWRARFGRGIGPVVRQTTKWMNHTPRLHLWAFVACYRVNFMWTYPLWYCALRAMKNVTDNTTPTFRVCLVVAAISLQGITWCDQVVSGLTARWHYCSLFKLLTLGADTVESGESLPCLEWGCSACDCCVMSS